MKNPLRLLACVLVAAPCVAEAYIGPGVGISAIGSFLALVGAVLLAIVGFLWFPLKRLLFRKKTQDKAGADRVAAAPDDGPEKDDPGDGEGQRPPGG